MKPDLDYPWQGAFREIAVSIAERAPTEQRFDELWAHLGVVVRFLVTNDPRAKNDPAPEEPGGEDAAAGGGTDSTEPRQTDRCPEVEANGDVSPALCSFSEMVCNSRESDGIHGYDDKCDHEARPDCHPFEVKV